MIKLAFHNKDFLLIFLKSSAFKMQPSIILIPAYFWWFGWKFTTGTLFIVGFQFCLCDTYSPSIFSHIPCSSSVFSAFWWRHSLQRNRSWGTHRNFVYKWVCSLLTKYKTICCPSQDAHKASTWSRRLEIIKCNSFPLRIERSLPWTQELLASKGFDGTALIGWLFYTHMASAAVIYCNPKNLQILVFATFLWGANILLKLNLLWGNSLTEKQGGFLQS